MQINLVGQINGNNDDDLGFKDRSLSFFSLGLGYLFPHFSVGEDLLGSTVSKSTQKVTQVAHALMHRT